MGDRALRLSYPDDQIKNARNELIKRKWVGFSLEDTLFECQKIQDICAKKTMFKVGDAYGIPTPDLDKMLSSTKDLNLGLWWEFLAYDPDSDQSRKQIFQQILHDLRVDNEDMDLLIFYDLYKKAFEENVELKPGALSLIYYLKDNGWEVTVFHDLKAVNPRWIMKTLGIEHDLDEIGRSGSLTKTTGLFPFKLDRLGIAASDLLYVGSNVDEDIKSAKECGILSVLLSENEHGSLEDAENLQISRLGDLEQILQWRLPHRTAQPRGF